MQEILDSRAEVEAKLIDNQGDPIEEENETSSAGNQDSTEGRLLQ